MSKWWNEPAEVDQVAEWHELQTDEGLTYFHNVRTNETRWDRPAELMTAEHEAQAGNWRWVPDKDLCFVPAKLETIGSGTTRSVLRTPEGRTIQASAKELATYAPLSWPSLQRVVADLTLLDDMNPALILHNLLQRFNRDQIYTNIGTILISMNPYRRLDLYGPDVIDEYDNRGVKDMPPHVYNIAHNALVGVKDTSTNQSVIVSGESGAGKTEATKQVLSYIASVSGSVGNVEEKILLASPILESFGNAKTLRNHNSSRFGKYISVFLNRDGELCASQTQNFLLEKVRVCQPAANERNFHIFYQLTEACSPHDRARFGLGRATDYYYTTQSGCTTVPGIDDAQDYNDMIEAMQAIGMTDDERDQILQVVAAILHLGNVAFASTGDRQCRIDTEDSLLWAASLLGVDHDALSRVMTQRLLKIRGQGDTTVQLGELQAYEARDALSKFIYGAMFDGVVERINRSMELQTQADVRSIGILDIFGFEVFEYNSFEQLCINFTNERLQQFFNANTFKLEEELYKAEGISFEHVAFVDNQPMVDLLTMKPFGVMLLLDEEVVVPQGSDAKFLSKIKERYASHSNFVADTHTATSFAIKHYAGNVTYETAGFLEKNRDTLTMDALSLLAGSTQELIRRMFASASDMSSKDRKQTLGKQFRNQLDTLMSTLYTTQPHYIRCIKPNEIKAAKTFVSKMCYEQLMFSGVFEAVQIRKKGFPFRQTHQEFISRYGVIFPDRRYTSCDKLVADLGLNMTNVRIGRTMVLYRSEEFKGIELKRSIAVKKDEIIVELTALTEKDPSTIADESAREKYFEKLSKCVRTAIEFNLEHPVSLKARQMLIQFIESRMDDNTKYLLESALASCQREDLIHAIAEADKFQYSTALVRQCKKLLERVERVLNETELASTLLEDKHMTACINAAAELNLWHETIEYYKQILAAPSRERLKIQLKQAVAVGNTARAIRLTIRMKEDVFNTQGQMFELSECGILKPVDEWAAEKFISFNREKLRSEMLSWIDSDIHSSFTVMQATDSTTTAKELNKVALILIRSIQSYMRDRKSDQPEQEGFSVITLGHQRTEIRDEIYVQILKQLTQNPNPESSRLGWQLLGCCIASFPPTPSFENFLEVWLRKYSQNRDYLGALHSVLFSGARVTPIERSQMNNVTGILRKLTEEYAESLPMGAVSYEDLLIPFDITVDELEFNRKAPKPTKQQVQPAAAAATQQKGPVRIQQKQSSQMKEPKVGMRERALSRRPCSWKPVVDPTSGNTYYWNAETGESTWDEPADLKFGVADEVKPRF